MERSESRGADRDGRLSLAPSEESEAMLAELEGRSGDPEEAACWPERFAAAGGKDAPAFPRRFAATGAKAAPAFPRRFTASGNKAAPAFPRRFIASGVKPAPIR